VFSAWKKSQSKARLNDLGAKFDEIKHHQFGKDGFDDAPKGLWMSVSIFAR
jgi:hypothetical protein